MINDLLILLSGFTIIAAVLLGVAYLFFLPEMRKSVSSMLSCTLMLAILSSLQWAHYQYFTSGFDALGSRIYLTLLLLSPPMFYFFSRSVIYTEPNTSPLQIVHFIWPALAIVLPLESIPVVAFIIGTAYTVWFISVIWGLREQRTHFHFELFFFVSFALMATLALIVGLALPYIEPRLFYTVYGASIGIAMILVVGALIIFRDLVSDIMLVTNLAYAKSKLLSIDIEAAQARLEELLTQDKIYQNENLNLGQLADLVELSPHQLSELINTRYGMGFPRFVRERRVDAAKKLLTEQPDTPVLAIGLMTGFKSQSNFYIAFKEATGQSPGSYRRGKSPRG
jgi:AraC-like DNA-binding protein